MQVPVTVLNANTKRETGKKAQEGNIAAAKVCYVPFLGPLGLHKATDCGLQLDHNSGKVKSS